MRDPAHLRTLHDLARTYHTDPGAVAEWSPERVAIGLAALEEAIQRRDRRLKESPPGTTVVDVGEL